MVLQFLKPTQGLSPERIIIYYFPQLMFFVVQRLLNEKLVSAIVGAELVTRHDVNSALGLVQQRRSFSQLLVPSARFSDAEPADEEIARYYEQNKGELLTEERVKLQYVELSRDQLGTQQGG